MTTANSFITSRSPDTTELCAITRSGLCLRKDESHLGTKGAGSRLNRVQAVAVSSSRFIFFILSSHLEVMGVILLLNQSFALSSIIPGRSRRSASQMRKIPMTYVLMHVITVATLNRLTVSAESSELKRSVPYMVFPVSEFLCNEGPKKGRGSTYRNETWREIENRHDGEDDDIAIHGR